MRKTYTKYVQNLFQTYLEYHITVGVQWISYNTDSILFYYQQVTNFLKVCKSTGLHKSLDFEHTVIHLR